MNEVVSAQRKHIGFFGMRNAGKSSLVNAVTGQDLAVVSDYAGTTTDPVKKAMELLPLGPVVIIDTPGYDDEGELGELRIKKTKQALGYTDIAVLCVDSTKGMQKEDLELEEIFQNKRIPYVKAFTKSELIHIPETSEENVIYVSAKENTNIFELKEKIAAILKDDEDNRALVSDIISKNDTVVLVIPIDAAAPKGRLILPQQQTLRDILDVGACAICCQDTGLEETLLKLQKKPDLVITDSQAFGRVVKILPEDVPLTSFSILFARYKGDLDLLVSGADVLDKIENGDKILISEGCTHHRQCGDIGTVKLPGWIEKYTGKKPEYTFTSGTEFPEDLSGYKLVIHCGGCMLNAREMKTRMAYAEGEGVAMTNYGTAIAKMNGILARSLMPLKK